MNVENYMMKIRKDSAFRKAYETIVPKYDFANALFDTRERLGMTHEELSRRSGIPQDDIFRYENGDSDPTTEVMQTLADALGMRVVIRFVPKEEADSPEKECGEREDT